MQSSPLCSAVIPTEERPVEYGETRLVIGVVCGLRSEKGLSTLVDAFARVKGPVVSA